MFSILDEAFERSGLPSYGTTNPTLGSDPWDVYIHHLLNHAGITVEKLQAPAEADEQLQPLHESVQIVGGIAMHKFMQNKDKDEISFVEEKDMEGVQVKLNNAYRWKVSVCEDIPELGAVGSAPAQRKRTATDLRKKVFHTLNHYGRSVASIAAGRQQHRHPQSGRHQLVEELGPML